jgi:hypothetical protein
MVIVVVTTSPIWIGALGRFSSFGVSPCFAIYRRQESIRQDIGEKYTELCSRQTPITGKLFGDDVDEEIKRIDKTKNLNVSL